MIEQPVIARAEIDEGRGAGTYEVRLLKEPGLSFITPEKVRDLWLQQSKHDVLFSDHTKGEVEPFFDMLMAPNATFFEVVNVAEGVPVGLLYLSRIIPRFDAFGHFAFWDSIARGREGLVLDTLRYLMNRYSLERVSAEIPVYQKGTIRFTERAGFTREGVRRRAVIKDGQWFDAVMFGILRSELVESESPSTVMEATA